MPRRPLLLRALAAPAALGLTLTLGTAARAVPAARPAAVSSDTVATPRAATPRARAQLDAARRATAALATPEAARAAGYRPMFGHVPLQGEHYVRVDRVLADSFDVERPSVLMFAPVRGTPTLVGLAYAYLRPSDAPVPAGFDGAGDAWHAHERLAPVPGKHLVMMHAWLVDAPEGPFARYNPWLPYLAAGLAPPAAATLADPVAGERARRLGLALASATAPPMLFAWMERASADTVRARLAARRAAIDALVPRLVAAERAGDGTAQARLTDELLGQTDALVAAYREAMPERPIARRLVDRTVDEFLGRGHGIEEELGALFGGGMGAATRPPAHDSGAHAHRP